MTPDLRSRMMEWLESGTDIQKRHATARLAMPDSAHDYPSVMIQAGNIARAAVAAASDRFRVVDRDEQARRLGTCRTCEHYDASQGRCRLCGCVASLKARIASQHCPAVPPRW